MESQPQNPDFKINPEMFTHPDVHVHLSCGWLSLCDRYQIFVCLPISMLVC